MQERDDFTNSLPHLDDSDYPGYDYDDYGIDYEAELAEAQEEYRPYWCPLCNIGEMFEHTHWVRNFRSQNEEIIYDEVEVEEGDKQVEFLACAGCHYLLLPEEYEDEWKERND